MQFWCQKYGMNHLPCRAVFQIHKQGTTSDLKVLDTYTPEHTRVFDPSKCTGMTGGLEFQNGYVSFCQILLLPYVPARESEKVVVYGSGWSQRKDQLP